MMKKVWAILLAVMMVLTSVTALSDGENEDATEGTQAETEKSLEIEGWGSKVTESYSLGGVTYEKALKVTNANGETGYFNMVEVADKVYNYRILNGTVTISGSNTKGEEIIVDGNSKLVLAGVDITGANGPGIKIASTAVATLYLQEGTTNSVKAGGTTGNYAGIEVEWNSGSDFADLTIDGTGTLVATASGNGAGIGGSYSHNGVYGNITINNGHITATGAGRGAGIGSSDNPNDTTSHGSYKHTSEGWGTITINGGNIKAYGKGNGAGIGGGNHTDSGEIIINDGTIYAEGDSGIGSGLGSSSGTDKGPGYYCAYVTINGGDITAHATNSLGAGIGGGEYSDAYVTITDGTVTATVSTDGKDYQGGAGIGGGYQGLGVVKISGGEVNATGGNGSPGIGNGALGASTTTTKQKDWKEGDAFTGTKNVRAGKVTISGDEACVEISGGVVTANGGYHGAGIGSGNACEWAKVIITDGIVTATGGLSSEKEMEGGAGIGSGTAYVSSKTEYRRETNVTVEITGGTVVAVGGWGAAGIGSGAINKRANSITVTGTNVQAYSDGTKFALDTRDGDGSNISNRYVGNLLQGTFMMPWEASSGTQNARGLSPITVTNDNTGATKTLTGMPSGYRSFATNVRGAGNYTVYTTDSDIANGNGAYFSKSSAEGEKPDNSNGDTVLMTVSSGTLSDNYFLYPVKTIKVEKEVAKGDPAPADSEINMTAWFRLKYKGVDEYVSEYSAKSIEIVNGVPQNNVYFVNVPEGTYSIVELDENGDRLNAGTVFGKTELKSIETRDHSESGTQNDGTITDTQWSDDVTVINTFSEVVEPTPVPATATPTVAPTATPTPAPTATPTPAPTAEPVVDITVSKVWNDSANQDGLRPYSVNISLLANGTVLATQAVMGEGSTWTYTFTDLPQYANGAAINYTVAEEEVTGYTATITGSATEGYTITNEHTPSLINIPVTKVWDDGNNQDGIRPATLQVNLLVNGIPIRNRNLTGTGNRWTYTFTDLPRYANGQEIAYTVTEGAVDGYTSTLTGSIANGFTFTNTHTPAVINISGRKTWNDNNNEDGIRPASITVNLLADGRVAQSQTVTNDSYSFSNLPRYTNGREIVYTITENAVEGYTTEVNGYNLTNTHTPVRVSVSGTKTWGDHDNQDNLRPASIRVNLLADGSVIDGRTVTGTGNSWSYSFDNLPGYANGRKITYTVTEDEVAEYETTIVGSNIYNIHRSADAEPETYTLTIRYWADGQKAFEDFTATYNFGDKYTVTSPVKAGYTVDLATVAGVIVGDTVIDVYYTPNPVTVTVYYQFVDGTIASDTYTQTLMPGDAYDVATPEIEGYTATLVRVSGNASTRNEEFVVWYLPVVEEIDPETGRTRLAGGYSLIDDYGVPLGLGEVNRNAGETVE